MFSIADIVKLNAETSSWKIHMSPSRSTQIKSVQLSQTREYCILMKDLI